ncbi:helix-turn-helix domain-containing protein [Paenibacillus sp. TRM 82003]|nr:helix-turn-helix domain-containing protein [Paenibacillus sp. TRM 82003]
MPTLRAEGIGLEASGGFVLAGHYRETDEYSTRRDHGMRDTLIAFTLGGEGSFETPRGEKRCKPGDVVVLRADTPHRYGTAKTGGTWEFVWAHIPPFGVESALLPAEEALVLAIETATDRRRIRRAFHRVLADSKEAGDASNELCLTAIREILLLVARLRRRKLDPRVEETLHLLARHMREPIRVDRLAARVSLSPSRLAHLFKEQTGESLIDAVNRMRIRQAALLLEFGGRSAAEAAHDVGFQNYNHFARQFRKRIGATPSEFQRRTQQRDAASSSYTKQKDASRRPL